MNSNSQLNYLRKITVNIISISSGPQKSMLRFHEYVESTIKFKNNSSLKTVKDFANVDDVLFLNMPSFGLSEKSAFI